MLWNSVKLWENPVRGIVAKCSDDLVAKVLIANGDYTEYTAMQFLAERAPDIPAPKPHGLIRFGPFCVIFISYIPSMTLTEAWPHLLHEEKVSVQHQLDGIFRRLRALRQDDGHCFGGAGREGVKDYRLSEHPHKAVISTAAEFDDFQFSAPHHGSITYVGFLRSFLTDSIRGSVFTHGDVRQDNILVKLNQDIVTPRHRGYSLFH